MNIAIIHAFVEIWKTVVQNKNSANKLKQPEDRLREHELQLVETYDAIEALPDKKGYVNRCRKDEGLILTNTD